LFPTTVGCRNRACFAHMQSRDKPVSAVWLLACLVHTVQQPADWVLLFLSASHTFPLWAPHDRREDATSWPPWYCCVLTIVANVKVAGWRLCIDVVVALQCPGLVLEAVLPKVVTSSTQSMFHQKFGCDNS
jgi:hypothetical protein